VLKYELQNVITFMTQHSGMDSGVCPCWMLEVVIERIVFL